MTGLLREIRYGARSLWRDKAFAVTVLLTLAFCIGANIATFAIVRSVLLQPLPVPAADSILLMGNRYPKAGAGDLRQSAGGDYYDRLRAVPALEHQAMFDFSGQTIDINGTPERVPGMTATPSLFKLLGVAPALGRTFSEDEGEIGANERVILSYGLWQELFAGDASAVGKQVRLNGSPHTIVGVMPRGFDFINPEVRFWTPLAFTPDQKTSHHNNNWYNIGRLKPGATLEQAQAQINVLNAANMDRFPEWREILTNAGFHTKVEPLQEMLVQSVRGILYLLWGGAVFVLLIGGLNIANLALVRLTLRRKEMATRLALGGRPGQITRQFLVENLLLTLTGGILGIALGIGLLRTLALIGLERLPRSGEIHVDIFVVLTGLAMAAVVGLLIGSLPLTQTFQISLAGALQQETRSGTSGRKAGRVRQSLVVAQVSFAFVLLFGAALLLVSFRELLHVNPGFESKGVLTVTTSLPQSRHQDDAALRSFMDRVLGSLRGIPGVTAAGGTSHVPLTDSDSQNVIFAEGYVMKPGESVVSPQQIVVSSGYFESMKIRLISGRYFDSRDTGKPPYSVIVDQRLAHRFWGDRDPIGQRMYQPQDIKDIFKTDEKTRWLNVVGVVDDVTLQDLSNSDRPVGAFYFPMSQDPRRTIHFTIHTAGDAEALIRPVRDTFARLDPSLALFEIRTMDERAELSLASRRTAMMLASGFGTLALFLSAIGIYGVLAYQVTNRRREIGIRVALGSTAGGIVRMVLREGLALASTGLVLGTFGAVGLRRVIENEIYGVGALNPLVMAGVGLLLAVVTLSASVFPARRASRVDPVRAVNES